VLDDPEISRRHAALRPVSGSVEIEDLDSLNGTWVNEERIGGSVRLSPGDAVRVGQTLIEVQREAPPVRSETPAPSGDTLGAAPTTRATTGGRRFSPQGLARAAARRPWTFVLGWVAAVVGAVLLIGSLLGDALSDEQRLTNNPDSLRAADLIVAELEQGDRANDLVIFRSASLTVDDPAFRQKLSRVAERLVATEVVAGVTTFVASGDRTLVSRDRRATMIPLAVKPGTENDEAALTELIDGVDRSGDGRFDVTITGELAFDHDLGTLAQNDLKTGELFFGGPAALVILLLVFGAVVAALIPLLMAIVSILTTLALVALIGQTFEISLFVVNMVTGMGLALGIDYSLFILSRYREERAAGHEKIAAIERAGATASRAVLFSGMAFVLALLGMLLVPDLILRSLATGAIVVGFVSVIAALTLMPAVLALLGDRINALRVPVVGRNVGTQAAGEGRFWGAIVRAVMRRPALSLTLSVALLLAAAVPILDYDTGFAGSSTFPDDAASKKGFVALNESFPGATAEPVQIVITAGSSTSGVTAGIDRLEQLAAQDEVFGKPTVREARSGNATLIEIPLAGDSQDARSIAAVERLGNESIPEAFPNPGFEILLGGATAETIDYTETSGFWMPIIFAFVLGLSFVLLMIAFRSIVVPLKAILLNLLSVGAAYGLLVLVFVKGVGADLLGFQQVDTIVAWVPLFLFSVLFGLSMDYHVFLLSRIKERFSQTGDNDEAVEHGVSSTARLITGAALIIIAVFSGFAMGDLVMFQQMGFGIAAALFIDATLIRSVLVPAGMKLLGERNWYLPSFLQWLPDVGVEGESPSEARPAARVQNS
ncbi:MAG: MMPL family transporter, partial [Actinomycetota bacterium]|nr:MMPL family transporter [Actinomycetota bacterium]